MRLTDTENSNVWNKEINITLTIRELQMIRDCLAKSSYVGITEKYGIEFNAEPPYKVMDTSNLYNETQEILETQGGYIL